MVSRLSLLLTILTAGFLTTGFAVRAEEPTKHGTAIDWKRLEVFPSRIVIGDPRESVQVVVTAFDAGNQLADVTGQCSLQLSNTEVARLDKSRIVALKPGSADSQLELQVKLGELTATVPVEIKAVAIPKPIAFESEVLVALSKQNCNSGACHGSPSGKGGFRLSLRPSMHNWMH